jgi:hypothetical protein
MTSPDQPACLLISDRNAPCDAWVMPQVPAGAALIARQAGESKAQVLRRAGQRARELRKSGYTIAMASLVLGPALGSSLNDRAEVAGGLLALLDDPTAPLNLLSTDHTDQLGPFLLVDRLQEQGSPHPVCVILHGRAESRSSKVRQAPAVRTNVSIARRVA